ncbi:Lcl domain-containing protein [Beijerinckia mobilis]|uniref:Lcl domain-containing protein n=1 Tax=Beijerinckia mobilis TaxID=231434 RepID=UPI00146FCE33|nr:DUF1566 domain-containing protein [Beijerinckia mobilis]
MNAPMRAETADPQGISTAVKPGEERWRLDADGTLKDDVTHLQWAARDNGEDVDWRGAQAYCAGLQLADGAWELPTVEDLTSLYMRDKDKEDVVPCGHHEKTKFGCKVPAALQLSGPWFWSRTRLESSGEHGEERAVDVNLIDGRKHPFATANKVHGRALCVQRQG